MSQLLVCINLFLEEFTLRDCLTPIRSTLPEAKIIVIDGCYESWVKGVKLEAALEFEKGFRQVAQDMLRFLTPISNDKTKEICQEYKVEYYQDPPKNDKDEYIPWKSEAVKRNEFFKYGSPGDYYMFIDADETIQGHPDPFYAPCHSIMLQRDDGIGQYGVQRIFRHPESNNIKIENAHHAVFIDGQLMKNGHHPIIGGSRLYHNWKKRAENDRIRHLAKGAYYRNALVFEEQDFRNRNDI